MSVSLARVSDFTEESSARGPALDTPSCLGPFHPRVPREAGQRRDPSGLAELPQSRCRSISDEGILQTVDERGDVPGFAPARQDDARLDEMISLEGSPKRLHRGSIPQTLQFPRDGAVDGLHGQAQLEGQWLEISARGSRDQRLDGPWPSDRSQGLRGEHSRLGVLVRWAQEEASEGFDGRLAHGDQRELGLGPALEVVRARRRAREGRVTQRAEQGASRQSSARNEPENRSRARRHAVISMPGASVRYCQALLREASSSSHCRRASRAC
jgi:hypothetical protein